MKWPYTRRVEATHAWGVVGFGGLGMATIATLVDTVYATSPHLRWWWPNGWIAVPAAITMLGFALVVVPVLRPKSDPEITPASTTPALPALASASASVSGRVSSRRFERPDFSVGVGIPGWKGPFQQAWNDVSATESILDATTSVYEVGPGVAQHFDSADSLFGWVLCGMQGRRVVAMAGEIWQALEAAGRSAPGVDALTAVGLPTPLLHETRVIRCEATQIDLSGGLWGDGQLVRDDENATWRWEPTPRFSMDMTRAARYWTFDPTWRQLRLRAIATLPWAGARGLEISQDRRLAMEQALRVGPLADFVTTLSRRRGAELSAADWVHGLNTNSRDRLGLTVVIASPRGTLALWAEVMLAMPGAMDSSVVACAELRVEHLAAWSEAVVAAGGKPSDDMRLSLDEVVEFFNIAGSTANELLPSAITDEPASLEWMAPPTTELRMSAEQRHDDRTDPKPVLADYVNMDAFGFTDRAQPDEMAVTIFASPRLDVARRAELTREAVVFMGRSFGYLDVTEDSFQGWYDLP